VSDAHKGNCRGTHGTGLERYVQVHFPQPVRLQFPASPAQSQHFGMVSGISAVFAEIMGGGNDFSGFGINHHGAYRHLIQSGGFFGLKVGLPHIKLLCHLLPLLICKYYIKEDSEKGKNKMSERIAKYMARSGACSRREAEKLILQKRVTVNGEVIDSPAFNVDGSEKILLDGEKLPQKEATRLWLYYKPTGLVTTHRDNQDRPTVFDNLPAGMPRVISVGRLDLNSEGLLLLTNNGELSRKLELPGNGWIRRYKVKVHGFLDEKKLAALTGGITVDGVEYGSIKVEIETKAGTNAWLVVSLCEGKNREIRKVMKAVGLDVARLIRLSYGPFQLGALKKGEVREVSGKVLREQLGSKFEL
jgi:pseudouridylate synthase